MTRVPPKVSVCVITYNHEPYIADAINSALAQEAAFPVEIVVGEDNSTDDTRAVVEDLRRRHPSRIRPLARERNIGAHRNFHDTYAECRGDYIALLDGDDYWTDPTKLARQVALMDSDPSMAISYHPVEIRSDSGELVRRQPNHPHRPIRSLGRLLRSRGLALQTCAVVLNRRLVGPLPEWIMDCSSGDWPLCVYGASRGGIGWIDRTMATYRLHGGGIWTGVEQAARIAKAIETNETIRDRLPRRYARLMNRRIAWNYADMSIALSTRGDHAEARRYARKCVSAAPTALLRAPRLAARMTAHACMPRQVQRVRRSPDSASTKEAGACAG